jgi:hypothetical protein
MTYSYKAFPLLELELGRKKIVSVTESFSLIWNSHFLPPGSQEARVKKSALDSKITEHLNKKVDRCTHTYTHTHTHPFLYTHQRNFSIKSP